MFSDCKTYRTANLQHAEMVLALLQLALKKAGLQDEAKRFEGLDLTNPDMAKVALEILNAMNVAARSVKREHTMAVQAVHAALQPLSSAPPN